MYENNVLKQQWKEDKNGKKSDEFIRYKNGRADFSERFQDILKQMNSKRIVYNKKGLRMEIWSAKTGHLMYHGEYNERRMREGWGIEYDEESGNVVVEGIWMGEQACGDHSQDRRKYHDRVQTKWKQHHRFQLNSSVCGRIRLC